MKVILLEDVSSLGQMGETIEVKNGYARNFLIPRKLAVRATSKNIKAQEHHLRAIEKKMELDAEKTRSLSEKLSDLTLTFTRKAGETGRLFGSVTNMDLAEAVSTHGITLDRRLIQMEEPIKDLGEIEVPVKLPHDVPAALKVIVEKEADAEEKE
jgi:large subunit ribosomal protein L9